MALINFQNEQVDTTGQANGQGGTVVQRYTTPPTTPPPTSPPPTADTLGGATTASNGYLTPQLTFDQFSAQRNGNIDENAIRSQVAQQMQSQIDATNNVYADLLSEQAVSDQNNLGQTRAVNARSGLLGSDFGNANTANQQTANNKADQAIRDEQAAKIATIQGNIDSIARQEIEAKRAQATGDADAYSAYLDKAQTAAKGTLQQLADGGADISTLDPQRKAYLYKAAGLDPAVGDLVYNAMKTKANQLDYKYIQQADGSTLAIAPDPNNPGKFIQSTIAGASPNLGIIIDMIKSHPDAGITPQDDLTTASEKIQNSMSYQNANNKPVEVGNGGTLVDPKTGKVIYQAPYRSAPGAGGAGGVSDALLQAITSGTIDPNRINSRTIGLYNDIAQAQVDAVSSHAGSNAKTNAYNDTYAIKTTASRLLSTIDKNLPLVAGLADKVNTSGIPGLDSYLSGVKSYTGNNPDVGKYINSLTTLRTEYANMLAKGAVPTDAQRNEASQAIPAGKNGAFYTALGDQLKLEGQNIISAADDTLSGILPNATGANSSSQSDTTSSPDFMTVNGQQYAKGPDGKYYPQ